MEKSVLDFVFKIGLERNEPRKFAIKFPEVAVYFCYIEKRMPSPGTISK